VPALVLGLVVGCGGDGPRELPRGRQELAVVAEDAVLDVRAPGTRLVEETRKPVTEIADFGGFRQTPTRIVQVFRMDGDPAATVGAYRAPAEAAGWRFEWEGCSRAEQATGALYHKQFPGFEAALAVRAQLATGPGPERRERHLATTLTVGQAERPVDAGRLRNGPDCLRGLDPSDPSLQPPSFPTPFTAERDVCFLLSRSEARSVVAAVEADPFPGGGGDCRYLTGDGRLVFFVAPASTPRAYYEDRQIGTGEPSVLLFLADGDRDIGAWAQTAVGPLVVVKFNRDLQPHVSGEQLLAVARALSA
jgi:hypothetical protein